MDTCTTANATTIRNQLDICEEGISALRALETILGEALWHMNTDWISRDVCNGLGSLFSHELDSLDKAVAVIRDAVGAGATARGTIARSANCGDRRI